MTETVSYAGILQRWQHRRDHYRRTRGETFNRQVFATDHISERVARTFVEAHHYSGSLPAAVARIGLFGPRSELLGVAVFSVPMNNRVIPRYCAVDANAGVELGRFVILDHPLAGGNCETFFLGQAFRRLREAKPHLAAVVSYSDPVPRHTADGRLLMPGHVGCIYQAHNGTYLGRGAARTLHMTPDGQVVSPRTLSKIRLGERGCEAAERRLVALGAPARRRGESGASWVSRVLTSGLLRPVRHPGNHVYRWALGIGHIKRATIAGFPEAPALAYPKRPDVELVLRTGRRLAATTVQLLNAPDRPAADCGAAEDESSFFEQGTLAHADG